MTRSALFALLVLTACPGDDSAVDGCVPNGADGFLDATLTGGLEATLTWDDATTACGGTLLGGASALSFESDHDGGRLTFLITLDGFEGLAEAAAVPTSIDLTGSAVGEVGAYSDASCTTDVTNLETVQEEDGLVLIGLSGVTTCTTPAEAMLGDGAVTIASLAFRGVLGRSAP